MDGVGWPRQLTCTNASDHRRNDVGSPAASQRVRHGQHLEREYVRRLDGFASHCHHSHVVFDGHAWRVEVRTPCIACNVPNVARKGFGAQVNHFTLKSTKTTTLIRILLPVLLSSKLRFFYRLAAITSSSSALLNADAKITAQRRVIVHITVGDHLRRAIGRHYTDNKHWRMETMGWIIFATLLWAQFSRRTLNSPLIPIPSAVSRITHTFRPHSIEPLWRTLDLHHTHIAIA